jgi:uncharacterized membrane protein
LRRWADELRSGFWLIPTCLVLAAVLGAIGLIALDRSVQDRAAIPWIYAGGPQNASDTLTTIASSMITFTALVFSIMMVVLQLTSSQFSPRALRNFLRDRQSQFALGVFVSTFAYAFTALSAVRVAAEDDAGFVPTITVTGALLLVAASVVVFVQLIHHTSTSLQVTTIIDRIARETREALDDVYPEEPGPSGAPPISRRIGSVAADRAGVITDVDLDALAECAAERDMTAVLLHPIGAFVCRGMPLIALCEIPGRPVRHGDRDEDPPTWTRHVRLAGERTMREDPAFGLRQLVDIAERALSPGVNDPTTAIQCLDRIHDILRTLATRPMHPWKVADAGTEEVRAAIMRLGFEDLLALGLDEIRHWGSDSPRVRRSLDAIIDDLSAVVREPARRAAFERRRS